MMIVLGNLETAERHSKNLGEGASASLHRALGHAKRGAQRASALTSRLLAFSRRQALDPKPLNVNNFVNGLQDFLKERLEKRSRFRRWEAPGSGKSRWITLISNQQS
jgi:signal transduction histidine kinase